MDQCLLEAVEGDAKELQLHPAVVWICHSHRSDLVLLALSMLFSRGVPTVGACWKGVLEGPATLPASVRCYCLCVLSVLILLAEEWFFVGHLCRL